MKSLFIAFLLLTATACTENPPATVTSPNNPMCEGEAIKTNVSACCALAANFDRQPCKKLREMGGQ